MRVSPFLLRGLSTTIQHRSHQLVDSEDSEDWGKDEEERDGDAPAKPFEGMRRAVDEIPGKQGLKQVEQGDGNISVDQQGHYQPSVWLVIITL